MKYNAILLFGAPGSGKGTQGTILGRVPGFFHCACGDVFRSLDLRTDLGKAFLDYSSRGELVPDDLTIKLWKVRIHSSEEAHQFKSDLDFLVLDGIPRNLPQARLMDSLIDPKLVFHFSCPDRVQLFSRLKKRALKDNRMDDANEEVIRRRLETYENETKPVLEHYGPEKVRLIDALQTPAKVLHSMLSEVIKLESPREGI